MDFDPPLFYQNAPNTPEKNKKQPLELQTVSCSTSVFRAEPENLIGRVDIGFRSKVQ